MISPDRVHPGRRGIGPDRAARPLGAGPGARRRSPIGTRRPAAIAGQGQRQPLADPDRSATTSPAMVKAALERHGLGATRLTLELTESAIVNDPERVARRASALKDLGARWRWTISAPAIRTSPISSSCRSTCSRSTAASSPGCLPTATRSRSSARSSRSPRRSAWRPPPRASRPTSWRRRWRRSAAPTARASSTRAPLEPDEAYRIAVRAQRLSDELVGDRIDPGRIGETLRDPLVLDRLQQPSHLGARLYSPCHDRRRREMRQTRGRPVVSRHARRSALLRVGKRKQDAVDRLFAAEPIGESACGDSTGERSAARHQPPALRVRQFAAALPPHPPPPDRREQGCEPPDRSLPIPCATRSRSPTRRASRSTPPFDLGQHWREDAVPEHQRRPSAPGRARQSSFSNSSAIRSRDSAIRSLARAAQAARPAGSARRRRSGRGSGRSAGCADDPRRCASSGSPMKRTRSCARDPRARRNNRTPRRSIGSADKALIVKSRRAASSRQSSVKATVAWRPSVATSRRSVVTSTGAAVEHRGDRAVGDAGRHRLDSGCLEQLDDIASGVSRVARSTSRPGGRARCRARSRRRSALRRAPSTARQPLQSWARRARRRRAGSCRPLQPPRQVDDHRRGRAPDAPLAPIDLVIVPLAPLPFDASAST